MVGTWSGSFTNESFVGPGAYQAKSGVRCFIDMKTTPGAVTVSAPASPEINESFIISWDNPDRETLSFTSAGDFENPLPTIRTIVASLTTLAKRGMIGFTFLDGDWEVFNWSLFGINLNTTFAVGWEGRNTNGLCTLLGDNSHNAIEVERTALGFYTVRLEAGVLGDPILILPAPQATSLPAENSPELRLEDIGMITANEIIVNSGIRNKNGQFSDNDLIQDPSNFMALVGQQLP